MNENKKAGIVAYVLLGFFSFLFFLYFTFPYGVLKESIVSQIAADTGLNIRIKEFGPSFPLGFEAEKIVISPSDGGQMVEFASADISLSLLRLLIGNVAVNIALETVGEGELDLQVSWGIFSLLSVMNGSLAMPNKIKLDADNFAIGQSIGIALSLWSKQANDMIKGTLNQIKADGKLVGDLTLSLVKNDPIQSSGEVNLELKDAVLSLNDPNLNIPPQNFKKALVKAELKGGKLVIAKSSGFHAQELTIDLNGTVSMQEPFSRSLLDMGLEMKLSGSLKENFGFLLSMVGGNDEGPLRYKLTGSLDRPAFNPF